MTALIRGATSDSAWCRQLFDFLRAPALRARPILIEYLYEPPDRGVPQRLYRYELHEDYLVRQRDDFEFGFELIAKCQPIPSRRTYGVYIIELNQNPNYLYVGQTWYLPQERLRQHLTSLAVFHAARPFKKGATGKLRPDLYGHLPRLGNQRQAEQLEAQVAFELRKAGFRVEGGH